MNKKYSNPEKPLLRPEENVPAFDPKQLWFVIVVNWKAIVVSVLACIFLASLYLWFTPINNSIEGKMEILDKSQKNSALSSGLAMLNSLPMGLGSAIGGSIGGSLGIDSEKEILKSNSLVREVVKDLGIYTEYRLSKWGRKTLLYQDQPVNVSLDSAHVEWLDTELPLTVHQIKLTITKDANGYTVETQLKENKEKINLPEQKFSSLPATIKTDAGLLTITENIVLTEKQVKQYSDGYTLQVDIVPPMESAGDFSDRLAIEPPSKKVTNMLGITLKDENVLRGIDFVNHLVDVYNQRANDDKNEEARKTEEFVNSRLAKIDSELGSSDAAWENSKKNFQITEPEIDAQEVMEKKSYYEGKLVEIGTELQLHDYLSEYVNNPENMFELIPVGIAGGMGSVGSDGGSGESASSNSSLIAQHNSLVKQRKELLRSMSDKAPQIQRLTESIKDLRPTLLTSMKRDRQNIIMKRNAVEREYSKYMGRVGTAPKMERVLTEIGRQREIKQGVYLLMLQKREETAMELANVADKGKLIETTTLIKGGSSPKLKVVLLAAAFLGCIIPICLLYCLLVLKLKIDFPKDVEAVASSSVIGEIALSDQFESIRTLRSNLLSFDEEKKVILIASDSKGDGKTYIANQLADSLSAIGKKVAVINADLRGGNGQSTGQHPSDILASEEFANKINDAKQNNDHVIIDTPALGKYNDAYQIAKFADMTCYIVKAGSTSKSAVEKIVKDSRLPNVKFVLNAIDLTKNKYKYYYKK